jgi:SAM-dependent MidA family methyltransferase
MPDHAPAHELARVLRAEIQRTGPMPFARFMELALYDPASGYYERACETIGKRGDFFTSVSVGPLFGELLATRFSEWLSALGESSPRLQLVEAGAHDGRLAHDILAWFARERPAQLARLDYWLLEPSPTRRAWQQKTLAAFAPQTRWFASWEELTAQTPGVRGIIFSNELLDAFPVRRLGWDAAAQCWFEWAVTCDNGKFSWTRLAVGDDPATLFYPFQIPPELAAVLPDGFTTEVCPAASAWWRDAAKALHAGKLLTIDYGLNAEDFFRPARANGTLRAYALHRVSADLLANPGEQDLTAHVNFSALETAGEGSGLVTEARVSQAQFLTEIAARAWQSSPAPDAARLRQFHTLTHPEHLGHRFSVLIQSRDGDLAASH